MNTSELKEFLDEQYLRFNSKAFIENDPISIPHQFEKKEDIEIAGFLSATIAWGNRASIIKNATRWMELMGWFPHEFIMNASESDIESMHEIVHRTFNGIDAQFFIRSLQNIYKNHIGLEAVFTEGFLQTKTVFSAIAHFRNVFFEIEHPQRTTKHVANVEKDSSAKRINMYLRWMVRNDGRGVDFGLWKQIPSNALMLPLDVHTGNIGRKLGLLKRKQNDWRAVFELTLALRKLDANDPVKYDFALFGLGVNKVIV